MRKKACRDIWDDLIEKSKMIEEEVMLISRVKKRKRSERHEENQIMRRRIKDEEVQRKTEAERKKRVEEREKKSLEKERTKKRSPHVVKAAQMNISGRKVGSNACPDLTKPTPHKST